MRNLENTLVGGESNTGIKSPNVSTLRPVKRRFFIYLSLHHPNNHFEKYFYLKFACPQLSSQKITVLS
jgi:hypothetical protein